MNRDDDMKHFDCGFRLFTDDEVIVLLLLLFVVALVVL